MKLHPVPNVVLPEGRKRARAPAPDEWLMNDLSTTSSPRERLLATNPRQSLCSTIGTQYHGHAVFEQPRAASGFLGMTPPRPRRRRGGHMHPSRSTMATRSRRLGPSASLPCCSPTTTAKYRYHGRETAAAARHLSDREVRRLDRSRDPDLLGRALTWPNLRNGTPGSGGSLTQRRSAIRPLPARGEPALRAALWGSTRSR